MVTLSKNLGGRKTPDKTKLEQFEYFERLSEDLVLQWRGNCVDFFVVSTNLSLFPWCQNAPGNSCNSIGENSHSSSDEVRAARSEGRPAHKRGDPRPRGPVNRCQWSQPRSHPDPSRAGYGAGSRARPSRNRPQLVASRLQDPGLWQVQIPGAEKSGGGS